MGQASTWRAPCRLTRGVHSTVTQEKAGESTERKPWLDAVIRRVLCSRVAELVGECGLLAVGKTCWRVMELWGVACVRRSAVRSGRAQLTDTHDRCGTLRCAPSASG